MQNLKNWQQYIVTFMIAYLAALIPSKNSNIHPLLASLVLGVFLSKLLFGDFDKGLAFTVNDIYFVLIMGAISVAGGYAAIYMSKLTKN
jgi:hypothetical protein